MENMSNIETLSEKQWYRDRVTAVITLRRAQHRRQIKKALGIGTPREALSSDLKLPERYIRMLLGEPALPEAEV